jgi:hypothetical protein
MAAKGSNYAAALLNLIFNGGSITSVAINATSAPITSIFVALHTADPSPGNDQTLHECTYTGYGRVAVARTSGGWLLTGASISPVNPITFGTCSAGSQTATFWSVGFATSGVGYIFYSGPISPTIAISAGVTPQLTTASTVTES